jgi:predicted nucleic acid-binding protein
VILLDTNVVSEAMRRTPSLAVMAWLRSHPINELTISAVTVAEIRYGLARLPGGARKAHLVERFRIFVTRGFAERVIAFDQTAADLYGELVATRERDGKPIDAFDAMIAATARVSGSRVATRDIGGFEDCGIELINPWLHSV